MLIRCGYCENQVVCEKQNYNGALFFCATGKPNENIAYRYHLADKLHCAVLERLLDPKNVAKGEFSKDKLGLLKLLNTERDELSCAVHWERPQRIIEEAGDVGAYLSALIDAVEGKYELQI